MEELQNLSALAIIAGLAFTWMKIQAKSQQSKDEGIITALNGLTEAINDLKVLVARMNGRQN